MSERPLIITQCNSTATHTATKMIVKLNQHLSTLYIILTTTGLPNSQFKFVLVLALSNYSLSNCCMVWEYKWDSCPETRTGRKIHLQKNFLTASLFPVIKVTRLMYFACAAVHQSADLNIPVSILVSARREMEVANVKSGVSL